MQIWGIRCVVFLSLLAVAVIARPAGASTVVTWSGLGATGANSWSNTANWVGGVAPSGSVGTLAFPALTAASCTSAPPFAACYSSNNNLTGITAGGITIDDGNHSAGVVAAAYAITGKGITLGSGGITAAPDPSDVGFGGADIGFPITLGASQNWTITGGANDQQLSLDGAVTGQANALGVTFANAALLTLSGDTEVGALSASGSGVLVDESSVNGTDGNPLDFSGGAGLSVPANGAASGPITMNGGSIEVGQGGSPDGTLAVNGGVTLDSKSSMTFVVDRAGTTPGTNFSQLTASGHVALGGAQLVILANPNAQCPSLNPGNTLVLLSTTGSLSGTFSNAKAGAILGFGGECVGRFKIRYTANSVTATVLVPPPQQGLSADVAPVSGTVLVNGAPLRSGEQIRFGSVIDTRHGVIALTTEVSHATETALISEGVFRLSQAGKTGLTTATLVRENRSVCQAGHLASREGEKRRRSKKVLGKLRVKGKPRHRHLHFRSKGNWGSAGVGDPEWLVADRCDGTYVHVYQGSVTVRDFVRHRTFRLRAGKSYVARAR